MEIKKNILVLFFGLFAITASVRATLKEKQTFWMSEKIEKALDKTLDHPLVWWPGVVSIAIALDYPLYTSFLNVLRANF